MAEGTDKNDEFVKNVREEIFSKAVRAGKRTYFFDVKATRRNDYYLTLTESKKRFNRDGSFYFEKHKIFLYKEDFEKFTEGLTEAIEFIKNSKPEIIEVSEVAADDLKNDTQQEEPKSQEAEEEDASSEDKPDEELEESIKENYTDVEFEDLEDNKDT